MTRIDDEKDGFSVVNLDRVLDAAEVAKSVTTCSFSRKQLAAFADIPMVCSEL